MGRIKKVAPVGVVLQVIAPFCGCQFGKVHIQPNDRSRQLETMHHLQGLCQTV